MEYVGGWGDGVATQKQRTAAFFACHNQTPSSGFIAIHVGVEAGAKVFGFDSVGRYRCVDIVTIVKPAAHHFGVGFIYGGLFGKFVFQESEGTIDGRVEQPAHQTQGKHIAALHLALEVHTAVGKGGFHHGGHRHFHHLRFQPDFGIGVVGGEECFF